VAEVVLKRWPFRHFGKPEAIAKVVLFLAATILLKFWVKKFYLMMVGQFFKRVWIYFLSLGDRSKQIKTCYCCWLIISRALIKKC